MKRELEGSVIEALQQIMSSSNPKSTMNQAHLEHAGNRKYKTRSFARASKAPCVESDSWPTKKCTLCHIEQRNGVEGVLYGEMNTLPE
tara:strand:- start:860 stop:1123 length:264 start_codon:yes stop_codon:yes gene_type:complete